MYNPPLLVSPGRSHPAYGAEQPAEFWRVGREAEGAPLLREYGVNSSIEGSNPSLSAMLL